MYRASLFLSCFAVGHLWAIPSAAQDISCAQRTVSLNIIDAQRRLIRLSDPAYFDGKIGGRPVKIVSIRPDERPHRIVILLDSSGSMLGQPTGRKWQAAMFSAAHIANANLINTSLSLLIFSNKVNEQIDFSQGAKAIAKRLSEIGSDSSYAKKHIRGTTALRDVVSSAQSLLGDPGFVDSIYIITDGGDNRSRTRLGDLRQSLVSKGVRLFVTLVSSENRDMRMPPEEQNGPSELADLAADTGGFVLGPLGVSPLGKVSYDLTEKERHGIAIGLDGLYMAMIRNDLVAVDFPLTVNKWSKWSLSLSPEEKASHKDWLLIYPRELAPCPALANSN
jgi:hypothetical protein